MTCKVFNNANQIIVGMINYDLYFKYISMYIIMTMVWIFWIYFHVYYYVNWLRYV